MIKIVAEEILGTWQHLLNHDANVSKSFKEIKHNSFVFPGGEVGFKLTETEHLAKSHKTVVYARLQNSNDVMKLIMAKNALDHQALQAGTTANIHLVCPYVPYARQDRVCTDGEAFSLGAFCNLLNSLNFKTVTIYDPHSDVTPALINNCKVVSQLDIIKKFDALASRLANGFKFVSPDAGANKKTAKLAQAFGHSDFIRADKLRDLSSGTILETVVYADDLQGQAICIADDICDGGRTFTALAKELKKKNAGDIILYVTHGIFSAGFDEFTKAGISTIYCTNSFGAKTNTGKHEKVIGSFDNPMVVELDVYQHGA